MGLVGEAAFRRHFTNRLAWTSHRQEQPRTVQPVGPEVLARRHAHRGAKQSAEVEKAQIRCLGQLSQCELRAEVFLNQSDGWLQTSVLRLQIAHTRQARVSLRSDSDQQSGAEVLEVGSTLRATQFRFLHQKSAEPFHLVVDGEGRWGKAVKGTDRQACSSENCLRKTRCKTKGRYPS